MENTGNSRQPTCWRQLLLRPDLLDSALGYRSCRAHICLAQQGQGLLRQAGHSQGARTLPQPTASKAAVVEAVTGDGGPLGQALRGALASCVSSVSGGPAASLSSSRSASGFPIDSTLPTPVSGAPPPPRGGHRPTGLAVRPAAASPPGTGQWPAPSAAGAVRSASPSSSLVACSRVWNCS